MTRFLFALLLVVSSAHAQTSSESLTDCDKYPNSVACAAMDLPGGEQVPSETREITLENGGTFAGGGCPADVTMGFRGATLTLLPMASACGWITTWVRPLFLLIATITAVFIVLPNED